MPSSINSTSSSPGGLITTGDTDNELVIQTGGTTAISIDASQNVAVAGDLTVSGSIVGGGDVSGPASSTDNAVARFDSTTGKLLQNSGVLIDDSNNVTGIADLSFNSGYGSSALAYGCRAWVFFNGTGTPAINASGNVSSITDNATGDYTVNFTNAMPDANYSVAGWCCRNTGSSERCRIVSALETNTYSTTAVQVITGTNVSLQDISRVCVSIFR